MKTERYLENCILHGETVEIYKNKKLFYSGPVAYVKVSLGTWSRMDLLSRWFDDQTEGCEFDEEYYLPDDLIEELYSICKKITKNPKKGKILLPSYCDEDYDEIVSIKNVLEKTLKSGNWDFRYTIANN